MGTKIRFCLEFDYRKVVVGRLHQKAESLGLTLGQLIERFLVEALEGDDDSPSIPVEAFEDLLVTNGLSAPDMRTDPR